jgi:hypothetical protein
MHWKAILMEDDTWLESHGERPMAICHDMERWFHTSLLLWTEAFAGLARPTAAWKSSFDPSCSWLSLHPIKHPHNGIRNHRAKQVLCCYCVFLSCP